MKPRVKTVPMPQLQPHEIMPTRYHLALAGDFITRGPPLSPFLYTKKKLFSKFFDNFFQIKLITAHLGKRPCPRYLRQRKLAYSCCTWDNSVRCIERRSTRSWTLDFSRRLMDYLCTVY